MKRDSYHTLIPAFLQDRLRAAVKPYRGDARLVDMEYMAELDAVINGVKKAHPQAFLSNRRCK